MVTPSARRYPGAQLRRLLPALGIVLVLAACQGGGQGTPASPSPQAGSPCRFVTAAEAQEVLGAETGEPVPGEGLGGFATCSYGSGEGSLLLQSRTGISREEFEDYVLRSAGQVGVTTQPVQGLGEAAFWVPAFRILQVYAGGVHLNIGVTLAPEASFDQYLQIERAIAEKALQRIG